MTKKELYNQLLGIYKKTAKEFGEWPSITFLPFRCNVEKEDIDTKFDNYVNGIDLVTGLKDNTYTKYSTKFSKMALETEIRQRTRRYDELVAKKRAEDFYATYEGRMYKEALESELNELETRLKDTRELAKNTIERNIKEWLGDKWGVSYFGVTNFEIAMFDDGANLFGHSFTIYTSHPWNCENETLENFKIEMNYGTMGSFDLLNKSDNSRLELVRGMGAFVADTDRIENLRKYLFEVKKKMDSIYGAIRAKEEEIKNPKLVA